MRLPFPRPNLGPETFAACGGDGGPDWYEPERTEYEMPPEAMRVMIARAMSGWTLEYTDSLELRERLEVLVVLNAQAAAQHSRLHKDN